MFLHVVLLFGRKLFVPGFSRKIPVKIGSCLARITAGAIHIPGEASSVSPVSEHRGLAGLGAQEYGYYEECYAAVPECPTRDEERHSLG
mmetsp:Transcript_36650/g.80313  ORF Transcript_36650/g.80313 Transcript_36650/m.80313 type:complete len:89 (+) Transcript_36650:682-948(+)